MPERWPESEVNMAMLRRVPQNTCGQCRHGPRGYACRRKFILACQNPTFEVLPKGSRLLRVVVAAKRKNFRGGVPKPQGFGKGVAAKSKDYNRPFPCSA